MESLEIMPVRVRITSILKKALLSGEYKSGEELSLTDIANKLGVSRTPVREAFQTLAAEGLIELRMNKGAIVKPIDEKFIVDHYEMRILLECEAVKRATERKMDVSDLLSEVRRADDNLSSIDGQYYNDLNQRIHTAIWKAADNEKLYSFLISLWNGPSIGPSTSVNEHYAKSTQEHMQILEAIGNGRSEEAADVMKKHIVRSMDNILKSFKKVHTSSTPE